MFGKGHIPSIVEWGDTTPSSSDAENGDALGMMDESGPRELRTPERTPTDVDLESLGYWEKARARLTPIRDIEKELNLLEKMVITPKSFKRVVEDEDMIRRTPKLAELNVSELEQQIINSTPKKDRPDLRVTIDSEAMERNRFMQSPYSDFGPTTSPLMRSMDSSGFRAGSPLGKFMSVPLDTLPPLRRTNYGPKNRFPNKEFKEAAIRARKVMSGTSYVDLEKDSKQYVNPFPILTLQESQTKKKKAPAAGTSPRSLSTPVNESGNDTRRQSVFPRLNSRFNLEDFNYGSYSQKMRRQSSVALSSIFGEAASTGGSTLVSSKTFRSGGTKKQRAAPKVEEEKVDLFPVKKKEELDEIVKILDEDAGLVSNWRSEFIDNKSSMVTGLQKKLDGRKDEREEAYHNRALLTKVIKIVIPENVNYRLQRKQENIWKKARVKLKKDRSSFPVRQQFYAGLLEFIDQEGGLRSEKDERLLYSIKRRMDDGFPVNRRLAYDIAKEVGEFLLASVSPHLMTQ
eukprot:TRINITY_DN4881_c0_g1_i22.p1 TRINITY_DN4881_c0_g1~~TRINITY_DN4881_c0_g1_i22.p1  ORF type:complete len:515 (-),score=101.57 TRINITY_DN4881_c0_g1_i22:900-2444(-)